MTVYDPYNVVVVPFPFTDKAKQKPRPALVISSRAFNANQGHVILLPRCEAGSHNEQRHVVAGRKRMAGDRCRCQLRSASMLAAICATMRSTSLMSSASAMMRITGSVPEARTTSRPQPFSSV